MKLTFKEGEIDLDISIFNTDVLLDDELLLIDISVDSVITIIELITEDTTLLERAEEVLNEKHHNLYINLIPTNIEKLIEMVNACQIFKIYQLKKILTMVINKRIMNEFYDTLSNNLIIS